MKILYSSEEIRNNIVDLFNNPHNRRIAIDAFVSDGAEAYLPNPSGLEVYCCPEPESTDPDTLIDLIERGAKVYFVDKLHIKVYHCEGIGTIVTSANLSRNALGAGNLLETGVLLSSGDLEIKNLIG